MNFQKNTLLVISYVSSRSLTLLTVFALKPLQTLAVVGVGQINACAVVLAWIGQAGLLRLFVDNYMHKSSKH